MWTTLRQVVLRLLTLAYSALHMLQRLLRIEHKGRSSLQLPKIPTHVGLVFSKFSGRDTALAIYYCVKTGVSTVDIYSLEGTDQAEVASFLSELCTDVHEDDNQNLIVYDRKSTDFKSRAPTRIRALGGADGRLSLVRTTRQLCDQVRSDLLAVNTIRQNTINTMLMEAKSPDIPNPDLVIIVGTANLLQGYLPWHTRLSEIQSVRCISESSMSTAMYNFAYSVQRFGT